jgi:hypothetical protein
MSQLITPLCAPPCAALGGLLAVVAKDVRLVVTAVGGAAVEAFRNGGRALAGAAAQSGPPPAPGTPRASSPGRALGSVAPGAPAPAGGGSAVAATAFADLFAEELRESLLLLRLPAAPAGAAADGEVGCVARVELSYVDVATGQRVAARAELRVGRGARAEGAAAQETVVVTAARFETVDVVEVRRLRLGLDGGLPDSILMTAAAALLALA